jgi:hypothetical protein
MRKRLTILSVALALGACGSSAAAPGTTSQTATGAGSGGAPAAPVCGSAHARTLATSRLARVYVSGGSAVFGCAKGSSRQWRLGALHSCIQSQRVGPVAVTGRLAAYGVQSCGIDTGTSDVVVARLTDNKQLARLPATRSLLGPESFVTVSAIVLAPDGATAWISVASSIISHASTLEVHAWNGQRTRRLDSGDVAAKVLELHGSALRWQHSGHWRSATLR